MGLPKYFDAPIWNMPRVVKRFWASVECVSDDTSCWLWRGKTDEGGYGDFSTHRKHRQAHWIAWSLANHRPVPDGLVVCHSCDNPTCVRPGHLFTGTYQDNAIDRNRKGHQVYLTNEAHSVAKTTIEQVRRIRELLEEQNMTRAAIAKETGVSKSIVDDIASSRTWSSVV